MKRAVLAAVLLAACAEQEQPMLPIPANDHPVELLVKSEGFADDGRLPSSYTCEGEEQGFGYSPPLSWSTPPGNTASFAIVVDDPDAPKKVWVHWVAWGLAADLRWLEADIHPDDDRFAQGTNDSGTVGWSPPCPPKKDLAHHYVFRVFATDETPDLPPTTTRDELYRALDHHVVAMGETTARFER